MTIRILEESLVLIIGDENDFAQFQLAELAEYGKLIQNKIIDKTWDIANTESIMPFHRETVFENGVSIAASLNKLILKYQIDPSAPPIDHKSLLVNIASQLLQQLGDAPVSALGINFKGVEEIDNARDAYEKIFFDKAKQLLKQFPLKGGNTKLMFKFEDSTLYLTLDVGHVKIASKHGATEHKGLTFDANHHIETVDKTIDELNSILQTKQSKNERLLEILKNLLVVQ